LEAVMLAGGFYRANVLKAVVLLCKPFHNI
jgi:hypothetical protein